MSSTLLERARTLHEELELLERAMYTELGDPAAARLKRADEVARDQVVAAMLSAHTSRGEQLASLYADADGARREEIAAMSQQGGFTAFYDQLKAIREYHRRFPKEPSMVSEEQALLAEVLESAPDAGFTGEEAEGKYVDMHELHEAYLNLKGAPRLDYCAYLKACVDLQRLDRATAASGAYAKYLDALRAYWEGFLRRTQPLLPLDQMLEKAKAEFDAKWAEDGVRRWQSGKPAAGGEAAPIDWAQYDSAAALEALGLEGLKAQLCANGLKCGGSLKERAERLFLLKETPREKLPKKLLAKPAEAAGGEEAAAAFTGGHYSIALQEELLSRMGQLLADCIEDTAEMIEKKQARTYEEIERDLQLAAESEQPAEEEEEEAEDKPIYNPLNLPLGWDGKPIPYWLYKLHGLNLEFKCEICGNYSYWGPRAFERHFQEWRHAYGMKCLGIPNTKPFHGITLIEDAYTLWAKLKAESGGSAFNPELDEEFEDRSGNVMNRKTYKDLARQGLLD
ncbi:hypothetical protein AB1Y20_013975 [Prymnesium parvum]|uniref:Matrin-type domain-containing protein n=1 Tax=Prymnesium parvum TaxID=97485 RepID=A0AB34II01_PRYPA